VLELDILEGTLISSRMGLVFSDGPYSYCLSGSVGGEPIAEMTSAHRRVTKRQGETIVWGDFPGLSIEFTQILREIDLGLEETITLRNKGTQAVRLGQIKFGFVANLGNRPEWRLCAIPFRIQLDGSTHDYSGEALIRGEFHNSVYADKSRPEPALVDSGSLWSEAWAWGPSDRGLVIVKHNDDAIELSVAAPSKQDNETLLRFGGVGFSLYGEPSIANRLAPGGEVTFGTTIYTPYEGGLTQAYKCYRDFLDSKGHTFPQNYNPPVHWNELYDVGWYHSDTGKLKRYYTREALLHEAEKARKCGCESLYLDPGWEVAEGTTLWDESRLGTISSFAETLRVEYGLGLAFRTILRCYRDHWPREYLIQHNPKDPSRGSIRWDDQELWELCLCNPVLMREKVKRILDIAKHGVCFIMFDEMDWRGPCYDSKHEHQVPTTPLDHVLAVYRMAREVRSQCPGLLIEAHDPVWPWHTSIYVPTYFQQGFGEKGARDENWGFEYMWKCLDDLKSGRALALYYYNLGCNIPLYLHITMAADNDNCLFFWWAASTIRHLGIGGKASNKTIEPSPGLAPFDSEKRFAAYQGQMGIYISLKPYFARGDFHGIAENIHLHTLREKKGGVVNVFNTKEDENEFRFFISEQSLGGRNLAVEGAEASWTEDGVVLRLKLAAMSPALVCIGDAVRERCQ